MRTGRAFRIAAAAALLAAAGCDFWNNLVDEKTPTRGNLEVDVLDAWTGDTLRDATCLDSIRGLDISNDGKGPYRLQAAATGPYAIRCEHAWYYDGMADLGLTGAGARIAIRLARRGGPVDWYPDPGSQVAILHPGGAIRYPKDLDWQATPADDSGRFLYEWTFLQNPQLDRGHRIPQRQLPKDAYSPRFRATISRENVIRPGRDTVILKVYSLLHDPKAPEYVGTDTLSIEWVENQKPTVQFNSTLFYTDSSRSVHPRWKVSCEEIGKQLRYGVFDAFDNDGQCRSVRLKSIKAPSLPGFDTALSCELRHFKVYLPLIDPKRSMDSTVKPDTIAADGAEEYDNSLIAEIVDDNGEMDRDTVHFRTFRNISPTAKLTVIDPKPVYWVGDSVQVKVVAHDTDGWFHSIYVPWVGENSTQYQGVRYKYNIPDDVNTDSFQVFITFSTPGKTQFWGRVDDNCDEAFETTRTTVQVNEARSP